MVNEKHEVTNARFTDDIKSTWEFVWENLQLLCLGLTIAGQILIGGSNVICLTRDFVLHRPMADKVKNAVLTAITLTLVINYFLGIF